MKKNINIVWTDDLVKAAEYVNRGFEPINLTIGEAKTSTDPAVQAYTTRFGLRREDPRFLVTGKPTAQTTFVIAALSGLLPQGLRDTLSIAEVLDWQANGAAHVRLEQLHMRGAHVLLWNRLASSELDATAFHAGVDHWRTMLSATPHDLLAFVVEQEVRRVAEARTA